MSAIIYEIYTRYTLLIICFTANIVFGKTLPKPLLLTNWSLISNTLGSFQCNFPDDHLYHIEDDSYFYSIEADSITLGIHYAYDSSLLMARKSALTNDPIEQALNTYTSYLDQVIGGQIISQSTITTNGKIGREIHATYYDSGSPLVLRRIYMRVYWDGNNMHVFSLEAKTTFDTTLAIYKDMVFNSIQFN